MNDAKRAAPPCKVHDGIERALLVSEFIIRERAILGSRRLVQREVNDEGQTHEIGAGNKTPVAAITTVIAVVAEHEICPGGNNDLAILDIVAHLDPPVRIHSRVGVELGGKLIAEIILIRAFKDRERLNLLLSVNADNAILQMDAVPGNAHHALDYVIRWVERKMEDDDIAAAPLPIG